LFICESVSIRRIGPDFGAIGKGNGSNQQLMTLSTHIQLVMLHNFVQHRNCTVELSTAPPSKALSALRFGHRPGAPNVRPPMPSWPLLDIRSCGLMAATHAVRSETLSS
jgi:hypothetical protein